jgi:arylsulfatase A-like enzyme
LLNNDCVPIRPAIAAAAVLVVLLLASFVAAAAASGATDAAASAKRPPNVVIVLVDDVGYGDFACHGNPVVKTPNIDRLHAESVRLTDFHVEPMCTPTRGELLTGVHCLRNGAMNVSSGRTLLRRSYPTLASLFAASGYQCGVFGKWHLGDNYPFRPEDRGFHATVWYPSSHIGSAPDFWDNDYFDDVYTHNGKREQFHGYTTDVFFKSAIDWMREQSANGKPFFCYLPTAAAHAPLNVPEKYVEPYRDQKPNVARFFGMIANVDENLARLEKFLADSGLRDNTLLVFMTDNGGTAGVPVFNAGMKGHKVELWEGGHRVPCFVRWPAGEIGGSAAAARDVTELTDVQDLAPTLLELTGVKASPNAHFDGVGLAGLLRGTAAQSFADRMLVIGFSRMDAPVPTKQGCAVMWRRWRLFGNGELYELAADPHQDRNVGSEHPDVVSKMRAHLDEWWPGVEPKLNEHEAIVIGSDAENPTQLSPADWEDVFFDQGKQVREGTPRNGAWNLEVARAGTYRFELRRWPREADAPIAAGLPAKKTELSEFPPGKPLPITRARIRVGEFEAAKDVRAGDKAVTFETSLQPGRLKLETWLSVGGGQEVCGAYYVYVTRDAPVP